MKRESTKCSRPSGFIPNETEKTLKDFACGSDKI